MVGADYLRSIAPGVGRKMENPLLRSLLTDQWFFAFQFLNTYNAHADDIDGQLGKFRRQVPITGTRSSRCPAAASS